MAAAAAQPQRVWVVVRSSFVDDYKRRSGAWSSIDDVDAFSSEEAADDHVVNDQIQWLHERVAEHTMREKVPPRGNIDHWRFTLDGWTLRHSEDVDAAMEPYRTGKFVRHIVDWEVTETELKQQESSLAHPRELYTAGDTTEDSSSDDDDDDDDDDD